MRLARPIKKEVYLYTILLLPTAYFILFNYLPIAGNYVAFSRYRLGQGLFEGEWVGLRYFQLALSNDTFWRALRNNIILSLAQVIFSYPAPIRFALMLNELKSVPFRRVAQTVSYIPHFLSIVVVAGLIRQVLSPNNGAVNQILEFFVREPILFLQRPEWFRTITE